MMPCALRCVAQTVVYGAAVVAKSAPFSSTRAPNFSCRDSENRNEIWNPRSKNDNREDNNNENRPEQGATLNGDRVGRNCVVLTGGSATYIDSLRDMEQ